MYQGEVPDKDSIMYTSSKITMPYYFGAPWIPTYSGDMHTAGTTEFKVFKTKLQAVFSLYPLNEQQKVEIIIGQLKGTALREANSWPQSHKRTAKDILERLAKMFDSRTLSELMLHFYARKQQPDETLREFALGLQEALEDIKACKPGEIIQEDKTLVSQFIEGVYGEQMKTHLKMLRLQDPTSSFIDFKETAIKILGTSSRQVQTTTYLESMNQYIQSVATEDLLVALKEQIAELIQGMADMYKEIKSMKERYRREEIDCRPGKMPHFNNQGGVTGNYRQATNKFSEQGQPICKHCWKSGHSEHHCHQQYKLLRSSDDDDQLSGSTERIGPLLEEEQPGGVSLNLVVQNQIKAAGMPTADDITPASAEKVLGKVVWFHKRRGYGFINHNDNKRDIFVHYTSIQTNNRRKYFRSLRKGETVKFSVIKGEKGAEAVNVTRLSSSPVQGSKDEAYCNHYQQSHSDGREKIRSWKCSKGREGPSSTTALPEVLLPTILSMSKYPSAECFKRKRHWSRRRETKWFNATESAGNKPTAASSGTSI